MAAVSWAVSPGSPRGDFDFQSDGIAVKFTVTVKVLCQYLTDGPIAVASCPGLPLLGDSFLFGNEYWLDARLRHFSEPHRMAEGSLYWEMDLEYSTPPRGKKDNASQWQNPLLEVPEVDMSFVQEKIPITQSYDISTGSLRPVYNSAKCTFIPAPEKPTSRCILTITRNEAINAPHPTTTLAYQDRCNSDVFWGQAAGVWLCLPIKTKSQTKQLPSGGNFEYLKCVYEFHAMAPNWDLQILDAGPYALDSSSNKIPFKDQAGNPIQGPLDGTGHALSQADIDAGNEHYITIRQFARVPFAPLNLPQGFVDLT